MLAEQRGHHEVLAVRTRVQKGRYVKVQHRRVRRIVLAVEQKPCSAQRGRWRGVDHRGRAPLIRARGDVEQVRSDVLRHGQHDLVVGMTHAIDRDGIRVHGVHGNAEAHRIGRQARGELTRYSDDTVLRHHHLAVGHGPPREGGKGRPFLPLGVQRDAGEEGMQDVLTHPFAESLVREAGVDGWRRPIHRRFHVPSTSTLPPAKQAKGVEGTHAAQGWQQGAWAPQSITKQHPAPFAWENDFRTGVHGRRLEGSKVDPTLQCGVGRVEDVESDVDGMSLHVDRAHAATDLG